MGKIVFLWILQVGLAISGGGCGGSSGVPDASAPQIFDTPVSALMDAGADASFRLQLQSETSMVRVDLPRDLGASRFVVGYNDHTESVAWVDMGCWKFEGRDSISGWAISSDGENWTRHDQLHPPVDAGVLALHGDPWLATWTDPDKVDDSVTIYVSIGQGGLGRTDGPNTLVIARSINGGPFSDPVVFLDPGGLADGPKIVITGDGTTALVAWSRGGGVQYKPLWNPRGTSVIPDGGYAQVLTPAEDGGISDAGVPQGGCGSPEFEHDHPRVAAGNHTLYLAADFRYPDCGGIPAHYETHVYRITASDLFEALRHGQVPPWTRIAAVRGANTAFLNPYPNNLAAQDTSAASDAGWTQNTRNGPLPTIAVADNPDGGEILVVATSELGANQMDVKFFRVEKSDTCNLGGGANACLDRGLDPQFAIPTPMAGIFPTVLHRPTTFEVLPSVFAGKIPNGTAPDSRVGIIWYAQPYKGGTNANKARMTIVEAITSDNGGRDWIGPFNMIGRHPNSPGSFDNEIGDYFYPCQVRCPNASGVDGYFGEYISAAFTSKNSSSMAIVGTWADSREDCKNQMIPNVYNQHVWSGSTVTK